MQDVAKAMVSAGQLIAHLELRASTLDVSRRNEEARLMRAISRIDKAVSTAKHWTARSQWAVDLYIQTAQMCCDVNGAIYYAADGQFQYEPGECLPPRQGPYVVTMQAEGVAYDPATPHDLTSGPGRYVLARANINPFVFTPRRERAYLFYAEPYARNSANRLARDDLQWTFTLDEINALQNKWAEIAKTQMLTASAIDFRPRDILW